MTVIELNPSDVAERLSRNEIALIDVREPQEFAGDRIAGAISFPLSTFDPKQLPDTGGRSIVFQCGIGKRSLMAVNHCLQAGLPHNTHLAGGLQAWKAASLPTISGS